MAQYAGRLKKRTTSKLKKWKSLYARLYPSVLCLFDDEITDEPRFTIPLTTIREISSLDNGRDLKSKNDIILRMGIGAGNVFRAESAQDAEKWIRQLRKTVLAAKTAPSRASMQLATTAEADYSSGSDSDDSHTATMPAWLRELKAGDLAEQMEAVNTRAMSTFYDDIYPSIHMHTLYVQISTVYPLLWLMVAARCVPTAVADGRNAGCMPRSRTCSADSLYMITHPTLAPLPFPQATSREHR